MDHPGRIRAALALALAVAACHQTPAPPRWTVNHVGNIHEVSALLLVDDHGNNVTCVLDGVTPPPEKAMELARAYAGALAALVEGKEVSYRVVAPAPVVARTESTTITQYPDTCALGLGGADVATTLVTSGWGRAAPGASRALADAEATARAAHAGMWSRGPDLVKGAIARQNGLALADLPIKGELSWAQHQAPAWKPTLDYLGMSIEDVIVVVDAGGQPVAHWSAGAP